MNFYEIMYQPARFGFAWAGAYGPIDDLSFLPPAFLDHKRAFWEISSTEPGIEIVSGGKKWPDILGCGDSPPAFFLSERVVESLKILAPIGKITEMPITRIKAKDLQNHPPPRYFVVQSVPGIEVDFAASNLPVDGTGKPILTPLPKPWPPILKLRADSWNGADVFGFSNYGAGNLFLLCTSRVKDLAERERWTNVNWKPIDTA